MSEAAKLEQAALVFAAHEYASKYDGDTRQDIAVDVLNAFFAGSKFRAPVRAPTAGDGGKQEALSDAECDAIFAADGWEGWPDNFNVLQRGLMRDACRVGHAAALAASVSAAGEAILQKMREAAQRRDVPSDVRTVLQQAITYRDEIGTPVSAQTPAGEANYQEILESCLVPVYPLVATPEGDRGPPAQPSKVVAVLRELVAANQQRRATCGLVLDPYWAEDARVIAAENAALAELSREGA